MGLTKNIITLVKFVIIIFITLLNCSCFIVHDNKVLPSTKVTVVIDVFRAFTTTAYVMEQKPKKYFLTTKTNVIKKLSYNKAKLFFIGKAEQGVDFSYNIPNSPTRVKEQNLSGKIIFHRTTAGAKGVLLAKKADLVLVAGFVNAKATVKLIESLKNPVVTITPMGNQADTPALEDDLCAKYIVSLLKKSPLSIEQYRIALRNGTGKYFFETDQWQYPREDFERCLEIDRYNFAIQAKVFKDYAILTRRKTLPFAKKTIVQAISIKRLDSYSRTSSKN